MVLTNRGASHRPAENDHHHLQQKQPSKPPAPSPSKSKEYKPYSKSRPQSIFTFLVILAILHQLSFLFQSSEETPTQKLSEEQIQSTQSHTSSLSTVNNDHDIYDSNTCSIYLAPSSIVDSLNRPTGFGIYTTKPIPRNSKIFPRGTGPIVPIVDLEENNRGLAPAFAQDIFMPRCGGFMIESASASSKLARIKGTNSKMGFFKRKKGSVRFSKFKGFARLREDTDSEDDEGDEGNAGDVESSDKKKKRRRNAYPAQESCYMGNNNVGSLTNFHPMLLNAVQSNIDRYEDNLLSRYRDPGAGSFSYHMGEESLATRLIEAGEEIFSDYEEAWFYVKLLGKDGDNIPRRKSYMKLGSAMVNQLKSSNGERWEKILNGEYKAESMTETEKKDLHEVMLEVTASVHSHLTKSLAKLVASNVTRLMEVVQDSMSYGKPTNYISNSYDATRDFHDYSPEWRMARGMGLLSTQQRSVEWIQKNGRCLDNIYPKVSTIKQAGQGAFAARFIPKGEIVAPVPTMLQVLSRKSLDIYNLAIEIDDEDEDEDESEDEDEDEDDDFEAGVLAIDFNNAKPISQQLLLNYCYGHDESQVLLCPSTNANLINHCSTRFQKEGQCDPKKGPNAKLQWATEFDPETKDWIEMNRSLLEQMVWDGRRGLSLEVVALRDIAPDEEIFIDYGVSWENAWQKHVQNWKPPTVPEGDLPFIPVSEMNTFVDKYLLTEEELDNGARYPHDNVRIGCYHLGFYHPCEILERPSQWYEYTKKKDDDTDDDDSLLKHLGHRLLYSVKITPWRGRSGFEFGYQWPFDDDKESAVVDITSKDIKFFAGGYSSDAYLDGAFRHHVGVPEGLWPKQWITKPKSSTRSKASKDKDTVDVTE